MSVQHQHESTKTTGTTLLPNMKSKSSILHKPKSEVFPTINMMPKKLQEVEQYYKRVSSRNMQRNKLSDDELMRIKKAFQTKIEEKKKTARQLKTEQSKLRWAIEREVRYRQKLEQQERMKEDLEYNKREVLGQLTQRYLQQQVEQKRREEEKQFFGRNQTAGRGSRTHRIKSSREDSKNTSQQHIATGSIQPSPREELPKKKSKSNRLNRQKGDKIAEEIELLKGKLRMECVKVIEREDSLNTVLLSLRSYT